MHENSLNTNEAIIHNLTVLWHIFFILYLSVILASEAEQEEH